MPDTFLMTKFIELSKKICVNIEEVSCVESSEDGLTCTVYMGDLKYACDIPYNSLVNILIQSSKAKEPDNFHFAG